MTDFTMRRTMMVDTQIRPSDVTKFPIIDAMLSVAREDFVPSERREAAYLDGNLPIAKGRVLLEPRSFAKMLDALNLQSSDLVLDIGVGLGYSAAVLARMVQAVVAVESDEALHADAEAALADAEALNVILQTGELEAGAAEHGPYDAILLEGGVEIVPEALTAQLKEGGRMAALFMDGALGEVRIGYKTGGQMNWRLAFNASAPVMPGFERARAFAL